MMVKNWYAGAWAVAVGLGLTGCVIYVDPCEGIYSTCEVDEDCHPAELPPGFCLDDRAVGKTCALYYDACPTRYRWNQCAGVNGKRSPWADRCVRPEFLPDGGTGGDAAPAPDLSAASDAPGPS